MLVKMWLKDLMKKLQIVVVSLEVYHVSIFASQISLSPNQVVLVYLCEKILSKTISTTVSPSTTTIFLVWQVNK